MDPTCEFMNDDDGDDHHYDDDHHHNHDDHCDNSESPANAYACPWLSHV